jgi:hypothetical protein
LLARAGGVRELVYSSLPVTVLAVAAALLDLEMAIAAAFAVAAVVLGWRRVRRVRLAFDLVTAMMALVSWARFVVQYYLYDTDQAGLLAVARIAMGWPVFVVTSTLIYLAIRTALRALPRTAEAAD